jgi:hypothetical protein
MALSGGNGLIILALGLIGALLVVVRRQII